MRRRGRSWPGGRRPPGRSAWAAPGRAGSPAGSSACRACSCSSGCRRATGTTRRRSTRSCGTTEWTPDRAGAVGWRQGRRSGQATDRARGWAQPRDRGGHVDRPAHRQRMAGADDRSAEPAGERRRGDDGVDPPVPPGVVGVDQRAEPGFSQLRDPGQRRRDHHPGRWQPGPAGRGGAGADEDGAAPGGQREVPGQRGRAAARAEPSAGMARREPRHLPRAEIFQVDEVRAGGQRRIRGRGPGDGEDARGRRGTRRECRPAVCHGTILTMPFVMLAAAAAIVAGTVIAARGGGGEMAMFSPDRPREPPRLATPADVATLRPPLGLIGYQVQATAAAFSRVAQLLADKDAEIARLREALRSLGAVHAASSPGPAPVSGARPGPDGRLRCPWCLGSAEYLAYHDEEWGRPVRDDTAMFERLCLEAFQSGLSWLTILRKRENFRAAFRRFDIAAVAAFGSGDVTRLLADPGIVRNRAKIEAAIANARAALDLPGGLAATVWAHAAGDPRPAPVSLADVPAWTPASKALSARLRRHGFRFTGPVTAYSMMQACGVVDDHLAGCFRSGARGACGRRPRGGAAKS